MDRTAMRRIESNRGDGIYHGIMQGRIPAPLIDGGIFELRMKREFGSVRIKRRENEILVTNIKGCDKDAYVRLEFGLDMGDDLAGRCSTLSHFKLKRNPLDASIYLAQLFEMDGLKHRLEIIKKTCNAKKH